MATKKCSTTTKSSRSTTTTTAKRAATKKATQSTAGTRKVAKVMREYKHGSLHSGSKSGPAVKNRKQAVAIALSEARTSGVRISKKN